MFNYKNLLEPRANRSVLTYALSELTSMREVEVPIFLLVRTLDCDRWRWELNLCIAGSNSECMFFYKYDIVNIFHPFFCYNFLDSLLKSKSVYPRCFHSVPKLRGHFQLELFIRFWNNYSHLCDSFLVPMHLTDLLSHKQVQIAIR